MHRVASTKPACVFWNLVGIRRLAAGYLVGMSRKSPPLRPHHKPSGGVSKYALAHVTATLNAQLSCALRPEPILETQAPEHMLRSGTTKTFAKDFLFPPCSDWKISIIEAAIRVSSSPDVSLPTTLRVWLCHYGFRCLVITRPDSRHA